MNLSVIIPDFFRVVAIVGTLVSLWALGLMPLNFATSAIVLLVALLGFWSGVSQEKSSSNCGGCLISAALPVLAILGFALSKSIGNTALLKAYLTQFIQLVLITFLVIYLPLHLFGSVFSSKKR